MPKIKTLAWGYDLSGGFLPDGFESTTIAGYDFLAEPAEFVKYDQYGISSSVVVCTKSARVTAIPAEFNFNAQMCVVHVPPEKLLMHPNSNEPINHVTAFAVRDLDERNPAVPESIWVNHVAKRVHHLATVFLDLLGANSSGPGHVWAQAWYCVVKMDLKEIQGFVVDSDSVFETLLKISDEFIVSEVYRDFE